MNLFEMHEKMTAHLFPAFSSTDERFLVLALCGEVGELADILLKPTEEIRVSDIHEECADIRIYLELIAKCFHTDVTKLDENVRQLVVSSTLPESALMLTLGLCSQTGLLANLIKKRWRDKVVLHEVICMQIAQIRIYLELVAEFFSIGGSRLDFEVEKKLLKVIQKHGIKS